MQRLTIGEMRYPITIQQTTQTQDDHGGIVDTWTVFALIHAAKEDLTGREFWAAQQVNAEIQTRFRIRYLAGVTAKMRIVYAGQVYDILAMQDPDGRRRELHLLCKAVNPSGS